MHQVQKVISTDSPKKSYNLFPLRSETNYSMNSQYILTRKSNSKTRIECKSKNYKWKNKEWKTSDDKINIVLSVTKKHDWLVLSHDESLQPRNPFLWKEKEPVKKERMSRVNKWKLCDSRPAICFSEFGDNFKSWRVK